MLYFFILLCVGLLVVIVIQHFNNKKLLQDLNYITDKINAIAQSDNRENIKVFTDEKSLQLLLQSLNKLLEQKHKGFTESIQYQDAMRKMLSNISHDMKTPLTLICGYLETILLNHPIEDEQTRTLLKQTYDKSNELVYLINTFFDLAKLESDDTEIPLSRINLTELTRATLLDYYDSFTKCNLKLQLNLESKDIYILGHTDSLKRILENLLSNALRYGSDGGIIGLTLQLYQNKVHWIVWDNGKGIEEKYHDLVFERLYTLEDSRNKNYQGSGIGLTITKRLIEKMNGTLNLKSEPNIKTVFTMTFHNLL